jgi:hypothetical protein
MMTNVTQHSQFSFLMAKDKIIREYSLSYQVQINFLLTRRHFSISDERARSITARAERRARWLKSINLLRETDSNQRSKIERSDQETRQAAQFVRRGVVEPPRVGVIN